MQVWSPTEQYRIAYKRYQATMEGNREAEARPRPKKANVAPGTIVPVKAPHGALTQSPDTRSSVGPRKRKLFTRRDSKGQVIFEKARTTPRKGTQK
jgi:hypothetical protein